MLNGSFHLLFHFLQLRVQIQINCFLCCFFVLSNLTNMLSCFCFIAYSQHLRVVFLIFQMHQLVPNSNNNHNKQPLLNPSRLYVLLFILYRVVCISILSFINKKKNNILVMCVVLILLFFRLFVCLFFFNIFTLPTIDRIFLFF
jgi:hypothetical protein